MTVPFESLPLEKLELVPMASGHRALLVTERISWEQFAEYAERLAAALHALIRDRADGPDTRVWQVTIDDEPFYLSFDDYPGTVSIEARSGSASDIIGEIQQRLLAVSALREADS